VSVANITDLYFISGDEPLQIMQQYDRILEVAKKNGFVNKETIHIDGNFNWDSLYAKFGTGSLFGDKRFFILRLPSGKPGLKGANFLKKYLSSPIENVLILIVAGKLEFSLYAKKIPKWYQALQQNAKCFDFHPIKPHLLPQWIEKRCVVLKKTIDKDAAIILSEHTQGNLVATENEIKKLNLAVQDTNITKDDVLTTISDNSKFSVFALVDAIVEGKEKQAIKIFYLLQEDATAEAIIQWAISSEIKKLTAFAECIKHNNDIQIFCRNNNIFSTRIRFYQNLVHKHSLKFWYVKTAQVALLERILKGKKQELDWGCETVKIIRELCKK
jgi:DNA polymerase III subunit delta